MPSALELHHLTKRFGSKVVVDDLSFAIPQGSICGFLGPNGAGKTTTIRMILDIATPTSGRLEILGASNARSVKNRIGYLPEEKGLYKNMRPGAFIAHFAQLRGVPAPLAKKRANEALVEYGLGDSRSKKLGELSKGMGQKVQVLASLAHDPELVILDEPFSGLDPVNQRSLEGLIQKAASEGKTVVFSTHVMEHAERLCDRAILLKSGSKIFDGSIPEAKALIPRRARLQSADDPSALANAPGVESLGLAPPEPSAPPPLPGAPKHWELEMQPGATVEPVLEAIFHAGIRLQAFQWIEPTLHDVFVELIGSEGDHSA